MAIETTSSARFLVIAAALIALAGCKKEAKPAPQADEAGGPAIMTSIDDAGLPVDKSDQITAIDAASGDSSGMPADGGAVVEMPKRPAPSEPTATVAAPAPATVPVVTPPPAPTAAPAGATTVPSGAM
jgi:hypothetical protein